MEILTVETIDRCNKLFARKTLHPLVCMIRPSAEKTPAERVRFGFYAVWLKGAGREECCCPSFGRTEYDFADGTLIPLHPGDSVGRELWSDGSDGDPSTRGADRLLCFHPSLVNDFGDDRSRCDYSFFRYRQSEALHLSVRERMTIEREMDEMEEELEWGIDEFSRVIVRDKIGLLLDYVRRFYRRQFITRHDLDLDVVHTVNRLMECFFLSGQAREAGLPTAECLSHRFNLSPAYLDDLLQYETGKRVDDWVRCKRIDVARSMLQLGEKSVAEIAAKLGFPSCRSFCLQFRKLNGCAPIEYLRCTSGKSSVLS